MLAVTGCLECKQAGYSWLAVGLWACLSGWLADYLAIAGWQ